MLHRKYLTAILVGFLAFLPLVSTAQVNPIQAQIDALMKQVAALQEQLARLRAGAHGAVPTPAAPVSKPRICALLSRMLMPGSEGEDVRALQEILAQDRGVYPEGLVTGYYGNLTEAAIRRLHVKLTMLGFPAASPPAGEDGKVGSWLRPMLVRYWCESSSVATTTPVPAATMPSEPLPPFPQGSPQSACAEVPAPTGSCSGTWQAMFQDACQVGWRCEKPASSQNKPPLIEGIDGPQSIVVNTDGEWSIRASDPEGTELSYSVTWGDEGFDVILRQLAGLEAKRFQASPVFSHRYASIGTQTMNITARDVSGAESSAQFSVKVTPNFAPAICQAEYAPVCGSIVVQCITAPCPPVQQTYVSQCELSRAGATFLHAGTCTGASAPPPSSGFSEPTTPVPSGMTHCVTPLGGRLVSSGTTLSLQQYFSTSTGALPDALARCTAGRWYQCDASGNGCTLRRVPASGPSPLQPYAATAGKSCSPGSRIEVLARPGDLLCRALNCAMAQEDTRLRLSCTQENHWTELLTP